MASAQERSQALPEMPDWAPWLQAGLTAMLAVLFVVMVGKMRQQSSSIRALQERVQGLENSRALERTSGLEQQLRTTVERLQVVERSNARLQSLSSDNKLLNDQLRQLRSTGTKVAPADDLPPLLPPVKP
jgi:predicted nuclease with TOPRIM domain